MYILHYFDSKCTGQDIWEHTLKVIGASKESSVLELMALAINNEAEIFHTNIGDSILKDNSSMLPLESYFTISEIPIL